MSKAIHGHIISKVRVIIKRNENPTQLFYLFIYRHDDNTIFYASVYRAKHVQKGAYMDQADKKKIRGEFMGVNFVLKGSNTQKPVQPRGIHDKASSISLRPHTWPHLI